MNNKICLLQHITINLARLAKNTGAKPGKVLFFCWGARLADTRKNFPENCPNCCARGNKSWVGLHLMTMDCQPGKFVPGNLQTQTPPGIVGRLLTNQPGDRFGMRLGDWIGLINPPFFMGWFG